MTKRVSRRAFLQASSGAAALAGLTLAGCGDDESFVFTSTAPPQGPVAPNVLAFENQMLAFAPDGTAYRLDFETFQVARLAPDGSVVWEVGGLGDGTGLFNYPVDLAVDADGFLYVADRGNGEIDVLDPQDGSLLRIIGQADLGTARGMDIDQERGLIYVADGPAHQVLVFGLDGALQRRLGQFGLDNPEDLNFPAGVSVGPEGVVHVVDSGNAEVHVYSATGQFLRTYGSPGEDLGQFALPSDVVVAPDGSSYVADPVAPWVTRFDASGVAQDRFLPRLPDGRGVHPMHLSLSPSGQLIVSGTPVFEPL